MRATTRTLAHVVLLGSFAFPATACSDSEPTTTSTTRQRRSLEESTFSTAQSWPGDRTFEVYVRAGASRATLDGLGARLANARFVSEYAQISAITLRREFYEFLRADNEIEDGFPLNLRADEDEFPSGFRVLLRPGVDRDAIGAGLADLDTVRFVRRGDELPFSPGLATELEITDSDRRVLSLCSEFDNIDWFVTIEVVFFEDATLDDVVEAVRIAQQDFVTESIVYHARPEVATEARDRFAADDDVRIDSFVEAGSQEWLELEVRSRGQFGLDTEALWVLDAVEWLNEPFVSCALGFPLRDGDAGDVQA